MSTEHKTLSEMLIKAYGPDNMEVVFRALGEQVETVDQLNIGFTLKDALVQCLFQEASGNCRKLVATFGVPEDPYSYFKTLMETPGLDQARKELDSLLEGHRYTKNSIVGLKELLRQQAAVYGGKNRLKRFLPFY